MTSENHRDLKATLSKLIGGSQVREQEWAIVGEIVSRAFGLHSFKVSSRTQLLFRRPLCVNVFIGTIPRAIRLLTALLPLSTV